MYERESYVKHWQYFTCKTNLLFSIHLSKFTSKFTVQLYNLDQRIYIAQNIKEV